MEKLPIIFRLDCDGQPVAVFPTLPYDASGDLMTIYAHVGQHGSGSLEWYHNSKKASPSQAAPLLDELRAIYERDDDDEPVELVVYQRITAQHRLAADAQRAKWREEARGPAKDERFVDGYLEALAFTDMGPDDEAHDAELSDELLNDSRRDCEAFQVAASDLLAIAYLEDDYGPEQAGRDFWFTRNGHGVGYWDRDQLKGRSEDAEDLDELTLGEKLAEACKPWRAVDVYKGDDGKAYLA